MFNFSKRLLDWYDLAGRKDLPWQFNKTPYRVWVSEIMLQQTQVSTVIAYFNRFITHFPDIQTLANASSDAVLSLWSGLGYYARGRNLHKAAQIMQSHFGGAFPSNFEDVINLPGVGRSTAGAILALSQSLRYPILDGNVKRVLCRVFGIEGYPGDPIITQQLWALADKLTPKIRVADYTQAIMDLGATLCTRRNPNCAGCPMQKHCRAYKENTVHLLPHSKPKSIKPEHSTTLFLLIRDDNHILFEQKPASGIWGGLWSFPDKIPAVFSATVLQRLRLNTHLKEKFKTYRHTFTHFHLNIKTVFYKVNVSRRTKQNTALHKLPETLRWHPLQEAPAFGIPAPVQKMLAHLRQTV